MGKQMTEMLKGTLEGIVLAFLTGNPAYGYEITTWLRSQGFRVLRFWNSQVFKNPQGVCEMILAAAREFGANR